MTEPLYPLLSLSRLRMATDGAGVTTLIAGAGCPLSCRWCINKRILREGRTTPVTAAELVEKLRIDDLYFRATGGGVCFGGGESLLHAPFLRAFRAAAPADWRVTLETSLAVPEESVRLGAENADFFIVDCKDMDPAVYHRYTGGDGALMEANLRLLLRLVGRSRIRVRVPLIPEFNSPEGQAASARALLAMGFSQQDLDLFSYIIREDPPHSTESR